MGILYSLLAGLFISLQGIFNARVGDKIGSWQTSAVVHGTGLIVTLLVLTAKRDWHFGGLSEVNKLYLLGGVLGAFIVLFVIGGIASIGASYAVTVIIVTQIAVTTLINRFGFFGERVQPVSPLQLAGLLLMVVGVVLYQTCR